MYIYIYTAIAKYSSMRMSRFLLGMPIEVLVPAHHANCQQVGSFSVDIFGSFDDNTMILIGIDKCNCHFFWREKQT